MNLGIIVKALDSATKKKMMASGVIASLLAVSAITSLWFLGGGLLPFSPFTPRSGTPVYTINMTVSNSFADYIPYDEDIDANAPDYSLSPSLTNVVNLNQFPELGTAHLNAIEQNGFVVVPQNQFKQIHEILDENKDQELPSFVTSDAVLHAYHVLFDLALREAEVFTFWDMVGNLTESMLQSTYQQFLNATEGRWRDAAFRNVAYFAVAARLLNPSAPIPSEVAVEVNEVLTLIAGHQGWSTDWFMEYDEDFSQYVPRGHYTRSELLEQYFKALMWYGRIMFRLTPDMVYSPNEKGMDETAQAILIALALSDEIPTLPTGTTGYDVWDIIYRPTVFFVGAADDLLPQEYLEIVGEIYGDEVSLSTLNDDSLLSDFIYAASTLRDPLIMSSCLTAGDDINMTKGMRLMGQRFIPDSYMLGQLVYIHVEGRFMPKGLDVMAALGSDRAWELLDDQKAFGNYVSQMEMLWDVVGNITIDEWTHNLYYLWLYSLLPLLGVPGDGYPLFMQNDAWVDKQLMTSLASWTELRHDTILYAKQSYTYERGPPPGPDVGYVEPVPSLYSRLASLCLMMITGLETRDLLTPATGMKLDSLHNFLLSLREISIKELTGIALNATEISLIKDSGSILEEIVTMPMNEDYTSDTDEQMALIADVHTDGTSGNVLEEAVGDPMFIYVAVLFDGSIYLTRGATFSYYEFHQPMNDRLTDEAWQELLENDLAPPMPSWTASFIVDTSSFVFSGVVELISKSIT